MVSVQDVALRMGTNGITRGDLAELSLQCTTGQLRAAEPDQLIFIMEKLAAVVKLAASQNLLESAAAAYVGSPSQAGAALGTVSLDTSLCRTMHPKLAILIIMLTVDHERPRGTHS